MKISRKYRKSAPEIRRFSVRRKISKPGASGKFIQNLEIILNIIYNTMIRKKHSKNEYRNRRIDVFFMIYEVQLSRKKIFLSKKNIFSILLKTLTKREKLRKQHVFLNIKVILIFSYIE